MSVTPDWVVIGKLCGIVLSLFIHDKEQDYDKTWNHLFVSKNTPVMICEKMDKEHWAVQGEVHLSWSGVRKPVPFNEGETFRAAVTANCELGASIDERETQYWSAFRVWICDVTELEIIK